MRRLHDLGGMNYAKRAGAVLDLKLRARTSYRWNTGMAFAQSALAIAFAWEYAAGIFNPPWSTIVGVSALLMWTIAVFNLARGLHARHMSRVQRGEWMILVESCPRCRIPWEWLVDESRGHGVPSGWCCVGCQREACGLDWTANVVKHATDCPFRDVAKPSPPMKTGNRT